MALSMWRHASLGLALLSSAQATQYRLEDDFTGSPNSFFDFFDFFTAADPTGGYVQYVDQTSAKAANLIGFNAGGSSAVSQVATGSEPIYMGIDHTTVNPAAGRQSVRITSKKTYGPGLLLVADVAHIPTGCGTWPALWMLGTGAGWPYAGEIDIIENVNMATTNAMTLHTDAGCSLQASTPANPFTGTLVTDNCDINAPDQATNQGCSIDAPAGASYGPAFNAQGGGTYAMEWTSSGFAIWFFPQGSAPATLSSQSPDTSTLGTPIARFSGPCDWDAHFTNMNIIIDTTLCGQWAGQDGVWSGGGCASSTGYATCQAYVAAQPAAFVNAFWSIRGLRTYTATGASPGSGGSSPSPRPSPVPVTVPVPLPAPVTVPIPSPTPVTVSIPAPNPITVALPAPAPSLPAGPLIPAMPASPDDGDDDARTPIAGPTVPALISYKPEDTPAPSPWEETPVAQAMATGVPIALAANGAVAIPVGVKVRDVEERRDLDAVGFAKRVDAVGLGARVGISGWWLLLVVLVGRWIL